MNDASFMQLALRLARRGYGRTSPNPMVGAVLVKSGKVIGRGWHRRAGGPHAETEALRDAQRRGHRAKGATLYVTLEPCCTHGRTPPCTDAIIAAGVSRVVVGASDPNPKHSGRAFAILRGAGIKVTVLGRDVRETLRSGSEISTDYLQQTPAHASRPDDALADQCERLNEAFNHWIVHQTPLVTVKAAMTLDGKIATAAGDSKWVTGEKARAWGMKLRQGADAILVGVNTIRADDPSLTVRRQKAEGRRQKEHPLRRIVLDSQARTPLEAKVVRDEFAALTAIVVSQSAPKRRVAALGRKVRLIVAPTAKDSSRIDVRWLLKTLGKENVVSLLVEGGGEVNASFLMQRLAQRIAFFYAPKILGGRDARRAVAGDGAARWSEVLNLGDMQWRQLGTDLLLTARIV